MICTFEYVKMMVNFDIGYSGNREYLGDRLGSVVERSFIPAAKTLRPDSGVEEMR